MKQFEYMRATVDNGHEDLKRAQDELDAFGRKGWQVVSMSFYQDRAFIWFMREIEDRSTCRQVDGQLERV